MGIDLHRISLGALIIALGLLVDDAMIAVEMMDRKLEEGFEKLAAATFAYTSTAFPMLTGTLITVAGFIPVGFAQSQAGEYVSSLFWVTGISLVISWFAAVYFTPWLGYRLLKVRDAGTSDPWRRLQPPPLPRHQGPGRVVRPLAPYRARVHPRGANRKHRELRLHPSSSFSRPRTALRSWSIFGCRRAHRSKRLSARPSASSSSCCSDPDLSYVATFIGEGAPRFYLPLDQQLRNQNFAQLFLMSKGSKRASEP